MLVNEFGAKIKLDVPYLRNYKQRDKITNLLNQIAKDCDSTKVETISYHRCTHEPASYNDWKKSVSEEIEFHIKVPEEYSKSSLGGSRFKHLNVGTVLGLRGIQHAKGFKFSNMTFMSYETGRIYLSISFTKEGRA